VHTAALCVIAEKRQDTVDMRCSADGALNPERFQLFPSADEPGRHDEVGEVGNMVPVEVRQQDAVEVAGRNPGRGEPHQGAAATVDLHENLGLWRTAPGHSEQRVTAPNQAPGTRAISVRARVSGARQSDAQRTCAISETRGDRGAHKALPGAPERKRTTMARAHNRVAVPDVYDALSRHPRREPRDHAVTGSGELSSKIRQRRGPRFRAVGSSRRARSAFCPTDHNDNLGQRDARGEEGNPGGAFGQQ
jgi:hypothetical protein